MERGLARTLVAAGIASVVGCGGAEDPGAGRPEAEAPSVETTAGGEMGDPAPRDADALRARARAGMRFIYRIEAPGADPHVREVVIVEVTDEGFRSRNVYRDMDGAPLGEPIEGGLTWDEAIQLSLFPHGHETSWVGTLETPDGQRLPCRMYESRDEHEGSAIVTRACFSPEMMVPVSHEVRRNGQTLQRMVLIDHE